MQSNECWVELNKHFPHFTGHAPCDEAQVAIGLICCQDVLLAHTQVAICLKLYVYLADILKSVSAQDVVMTQVSPFQDRIIRLCKL